MGIQPLLVNTPTHARTHTQLQRWMPFNYNTQQITNKQPTTNNQQQTIHKQRHTVGVRDGS